MYNIEVWKQPIMKGLYGQVLKETNMKSEGI